MQELNKIIEEVYERPMPKKENAETKAGKEQREKRELRERRSGQLADANSALGALKRELQTTHSTLGECDALSNHSKGFYEEITRLAKGKALLPVTNLMVEEANNIIHDAKGIVTNNDVYLNRIKEFVPAGDNPVYPDVIVSIRSVRDSLERFHKDLDARLKTIKGTVQKAKTIVGALEYFLNDEEADEEERNYPSKDAVETYVDGDVSDSCFSQFADTFDKYFDFNKLDTQTLRDYLSMSTDDEAKGAETETNDEQPAAPEEADQVQDVEEDSEE